MNYIYKTLTTNKSKMKKVLLTFALILVAQIGFAQQQDQAFKKDVLKLLELSGSTSTMKVAMDQIIQKVPKEKHSAFQKDFEALMPGLYDKMATIYMEIYTKEDVKGMIAFYETPIGKKMTAKAGEITQKSMTVAGEWASKNLQPLIMKYSN